MLNSEQEELKALIGITSERLGSLPPYVVEKDIYVTEAIKIVTRVPDDSFELVFQGGTSLAKAHKILQRMSEDCDFRIKIKESAQLTSKEKKRKALRQFRRKIVKALRANSFVIADTDIRVRNEGQFMAINASYESMFNVVESIKPYIAVEFFLGSVKTPTIAKPVTNLIKQTLGDKVFYSEFPVNSVSVIETAAEKWVALTRRVANIAHRKHYRDKSLVRHLYDLYMINENGLFTEQFSTLTAKIVDDDRRQYKNHSERYYCDPIGEINRSITELHNNSEWRDYWSQFIETMVFGETKPSYDAVLENLTNKSTHALQVLNHNPITDLDNTVSTFS